MSSLRFSRLFTKLQKTQRVSSQKCKLKPLTNPRLWRRPLTMIVSSNRYGERKEKSTTELITGSERNQEEEAEEEKRNENKFTGNRNENVQQSKSNTTTRRRCENKKNRRK